MAELTPIEKYDQDLAAHTKSQSILRANAAGLTTAILTVIFCTYITYTTHFAFGFFKILFGVLTGIAVLYIGKGSGSKFGNIAGFYAAFAMIGYEWILSTFFIASNDPSLIRGEHLEETKQFLIFGQSISKIVYEVAAGGVAYYIGYRIAKNPMKKDELDYLLEAKGIDSSNIGKRRR